MPIRKFGFTIAEMAIAIGIVGLLMAVVLPAISKIQSGGRDGQVRSDIQRLKVALLKAKEANSDYQYPGVSGWQCVKSSGSCWSSPSYSGNTTITNAISPYLPAGVIPQPPGTSSGQKRYDAYLFNPYLPQSQALSGNVYGPILVWYQEKPINDCNGYTTSYESGIYYCYEKLQQ